MQSYFNLLGAAILNFYDVMWFPVFLSAKFYVEKSVKGRSYVIKTQNGTVQGFKNEGAQPNQNGRISPKKSTSNSFRSKGPLEAIVFLSKY